jgi:hypothetical protein
MSRTKTTLLAALVVTAGMLAARPAAAQQINTSAFGCLPSFPYNQANAGLGAYLNPTNGSKPDSIIVTGAYGMLLACPVSRSPIAAGESYQFVYIDGHQPAGQTMSCTVQSYNYNNTLLGSYAVSSTSGTFDMGVAVPAAAATQFAYYIASCFLNTGGNQKLLGFTVYQ